MILFTKPSRAINWPHRSCSPTILTAHLANICTPLRIFNLFVSSNPMECWCEFLLFILPAFFQNFNILFLCQVRNESAKDFLRLLKELPELYARYDVHDEEKGKSKVMENADGMTDNTKDEGGKGGVAHRHKVVHHHKEDGAEEGEEDKAAGQGVANGDKASNKAQQSNAMTGQEENGDDEATKMPKDEDMNEKEDGDDHVRRSKRKKSGRQQESKAVKGEAEENVSDDELLDEGEFVVSKISGVKFMPKLVLGHGHGKGTSLEEGIYFKVRGYNTMCRGNFKIF